MAFLTPISYLFLTTKPMLRMLDTRQHEWLQILPLVAIDPATLRVRITYTDATTANANVDLTALRAYEVKMVDLSFATRAYQDEEPLKTILKIEVWVDADAGAGDKITFVPWTPNTDNLTQLLYFNSLGGMDSLICTGDSEAAYQFTGEVAVRQVDEYFQTHVGAEQAVNRRVRQNFVAGTGHKPKAEIQAVADMLHVNSLYVIETFAGEDKMVAAMANTDSLTLPAKLSNLNALNIPYRYRWNDRALDRVQP